MSVLKILLYGGCHALVLRDLFEDVVDQNVVEISLLINFHLISSGQPFPYERLEWCDVLIYSPIENKGDYNTDLLLERCQAAQVQALCFPWMEWHGYCPGAFKGVFKGRFQWYYPKLAELAEQFDRFGSFVDYVFAHFPSDDVIDRSVARSSGKLASSEDRHNMPIRIADFIKASFRDSRLFLISDHPSLTLYLHVLGQIFDHLGLPRLREPSCVEPQWRWRTPIFPRVAERLGLRFTDTSWVDDELVPGCTSSIESYLSLYFHKDSVILGPLDAPESIFGTELLPQRTPVGRTTRIVASPLTKSDGRYGEYVCLETLSGPEIALEPDTRFAIDTSQWRSTWDF